MAKHIKIVEERDADGMCKYTCPKCDCVMQFAMTTGVGDSLVDHYTCTNPDCGYYEDEYQAWERNKAQIIKQMKREFEQKHQHVLAVANNICLICGVKVA